MNRRSVQELIRQTLRAIDPCSVKCGKIRIGGDGDGGYVMADDFSRNEVCYSIGVGPQVQWDVEMAERGKKIFQYDHTVDSVPASHPLFTYFKKGIGFDASDPDLMTLDTMLADNGHEHLRNMILKMDVEGAEWDVLLHLNSSVLSRFDQIVLEFHGFEFLGQISFMERARAVFEKIGLTHRCIHVHANNYGEYCVIEGVPVPSVFELTYCRRGAFEFDDEPDFFPTDLDTPCDLSKPDFYLGQFRF